MPPLNRTALAAAGAAVAVTSSVHAAQVWGVAAPRLFSCHAALTATPAWEVTSTITAVALELTLTNDDGSVGVAVPWTLGLGGESGDSGAAHADATLLGRPLALFDLEDAGAGTGTADSAPASALALTAPHFWQALPPGASTTVSLIVQVPAGSSAQVGAALASSPGGVTINGVPCGVEVVGVGEGGEGGVPEAGTARLLPLPPLPPPGEDAATDAGAPAPAPPDLGASAPAPSSAAAATPQRAEMEAAAAGHHPHAAVRSLTTRGGQLVVAATGAPVFLAGVNWFGFDTPGGTTMLDGLWAGGSGLTGDLSTIVYRLQLLGFNAVRLPFSMRELFEAAPRGVGRAGCTPTSPRAVVAATAPPGTPAAVLARAPPPSRAYAPSRAGTCSSYVPSVGTVLDRFAWTADFFVRHGFTVVADYQLNTDASAIEDTGKWVSRWAEVARKLVSAYPATAGRVILDIMNEPDSVGEFCCGCGCEKDCMWRAGAAAAAGAREREER